MTKLVFDRLMEGAREMLAIARGEAEPYAVHHPIPAERHRGAPADEVDDDQLDDIRRQVADEIDSENWKIIDGPAW